MRPKTSSRRRRPRHGAAGARRAARTSTRRGWPVWRATHAAPGAGAGDASRPALPGRPAGRDAHRALIERYVEAWPLAEVAARLGMSEGAVAARLHRGKLTLRRILATDLRADAASYGLVSPDGDTWQPTRIWCPDCGTHRLLG